MNEQERRRRIAAIKTADAINAINEETMAARLESHKQLAAK